MMKWNSVLETSLEAGSNMRDVVYVVCKFLLQLLTWYPANSYRESTVVLGQCLTPASGDEPSLAY